MALPSCKAHTPVVTEAKRQHGPAMEVVSHDWSSVVGPWIPDGLLVNKIGEMMDKDND